MKESKRTEGKWEVCIDRDDLFPHIHIGGIGVGENGHCDRFNGVVIHSTLNGAGMPEHNANAEFIVKAVNNHDGLVEALREIASETNAKYVGTFREYNPTYGATIALKALKEIEGN